MFVLFKVGLGRLQMLTSFKHAAKNDLLRVSFTSVYWFVRYFPDRQSQCQRFRQRCCIMCRFQRMWCEWHSASTPQFNLNINSATKTLLAKYFTNHRTDSEQTFRKIKLITDNHPFELHWKCLPQTPDLKKTNLKGYNCGCFAYN